MSSTTCYELDKKEIKKRILTEGILSEEMEEETLSKNSDEIKVKSSTIEIPFHKFVKEINISFSFNKTKRKLTQEVINRIKWINENPNEPLGKYEEKTRNFDYQNIKKYVLKLIIEKPDITTSKIIDALNFETWAILDILDELREEGIVE